ncbi:helix-turn-helix domain-containing protein [uncultured Clostridium sp.]|uniref:helix-turn-helix domain-containing protein n=1 Tax=uncultured Clostridium sp. TaxID=59620 RepID=UPI002598CCD1|nr:helix-turn-helix domain-containing protein [uncultured Clostridium sp.]
MGKVIINNRPYTKDSKGFYIMPNELHLLLHEMGCNAYDKLIYEAMVRYSNNSENNPFPSYKKLQEWASCSKGSVAKSLKHLQELELLEVLQKGTREGQSNTYKIKYVYGQLEANQEANKPNPPAMKKPQEKVQIPFKRGVHAEVMTSKEAEELSEASKGYSDMDYSSFDLI